MVPPQTLSVTFVLPNVQLTPSGGPKVVYEYANGLVARGHRVTVVHLKERTVGFRPRLVAGARELRSRWRGRTLGRGAHWVSHDPRVEMVYLPELTAPEAAATLPPADIVLSTFWTTWAPIALAAPDRGRRVQLVQDYEVWAAPESVVDAVLLEPTPKVVISFSLRDLLQELGVPSSLIWTVPNGVDHRVFRPRTSSEARRPRVAFMTNLVPRKGLDIAVAALTHVRAVRPDATFVAYGVVRRPALLPEWIEYVQLPSPEYLAGEILDSSAVFLCPSRREGWALPVTEAMATGCAVVSTRNGGVESYAIDGRNALLRDVDDSAGLGDAVVRLLDDVELRCRLVEAALETVEEFTWEASVRRFEQALAEILESHDGS
jgi:glycosyltransferase involved in cell wall biosynthesis